MLSQKSLKTVSTAPDLDEAHVALATAATCPPSDRIDCTNSTSRSSRPEGPTGIRDDQEMGRRNLVSECIANLSGGNRLGTVEAILQWIAKHVVVDDKPDVLPSRNVVSQAGIDPEFF